MTVTARVQNLLIAILALIAVGLSVLAYRTVNLPGGEALGPPPAAATSPTSDDDLATATGDGADSTATSDADGTGTDSDVRTGSADGDLADWVDAWSGPDSDLLVVSDGFSHLPEQWVQQWALLTGTEGGRPVAIHHWGEEQDVSFNEPLELTSGDGPGLTVWSGGRYGTTIADAADHVAAFAEASTGADAVLVSLGQGSPGEDVAAGLDALLAQIDATYPDTPVLVVVGPAGLYDAAVLDEMAAWTEDNADRVAAVDMRDLTDAGPTAEQWAAAFAAALPQP
ncbi:hypothetical protein [Ornithinimicrobium tianjinense]|uniref:GDSL-like Lipase/Acylhydrolase family protein n=1 Tax=Ornithinimicrobium tianjinense TaxID=1195761 RepID=A0A917BV95_9MICO|nr:hypothetical protein [Ornithinimicrobium tianjinense]GGF58680.1 hypothetical protein GCM10011366_28140 [Ornithinimicrobium tianjinense]